MEAVKRSLFSPEPNDHPALACSNPPSVLASIKPWRDEEVLRIRQPTRKVILRRTNGSGYDLRCAISSGNHTMLVDRIGGKFLLIEIIQGMGVTLRYMFKPKATLNYPYEKSPESPRFAVNMPYGITLMEKSVALPANFARPYALRSASSSKPSPVKMGPGARHATT